MTQTLRPLVEAAKQGDREAINTLSGCVDRFVRLFRGNLSRSVRRAYGSTIDFVCEGLAEAMSRLEDFEYRSDEEFYAWASRHIRNRIVSAGRHGGRQKRAGHPQDLGEADGQLESPDPTASQIVSKKEVRDAAGKALVDLQLRYPEEMDVVLLKVFEGESWASIQQILGLSSQKRARTLFARGVDFLRPEVEKNLGRPAIEEFLGL